MRNYFKKWLQQWKELLSDSKFRWSLILAAIVIALAYYLNYRAVLYIHQIPVLSVGDLILDNIPTYDLTFMYTSGIYLVAIIVALYPILFKPELVPFTMKAVAAFVMIRAGFISLTHLGAPENYFQLPQFDQQVGVFRIFYTNDLFFSGHTGFPFLGALIFWQNKYLRYFLLLMSFGQAITVLLMHVHYSIDVFAAYFITYSIFVVSKKVFSELNDSFKRIVRRIELRMGLREFE